MDNSRWIRAGINSTRPLWGLKDGIQIGIWPASIEGNGAGGPRGLFRIGYPIKKDGKEQGLINFIAVEPIVAGRRGYSELERSPRDGKQGRIFWSGTLDHPQEAIERGILTKNSPGEKLSVSVFCEKFDNGAIPIIDLEIRSENPNEVRLTTRAAPGSGKMESCILTATMGNYMRLRRLHLKGGIVEAKSVWPDFNGDEFTRDAYFPLDRLPSTKSGDLLICATTDEPDPGSTPPDPQGPSWHYRGSFPVTQYWRMEKGSWGPELKLRVNGRKRYWATHNPIPGGIAYENFDLVSPFQEGQTFIFGLSRKTAEELGVHI